MFYEPSWVELAVLWGVFFVAFVSLVAWSQDEYPGDDDL